MGSEGEELPGLTWRERQRMIWRAREVSDRALRREAMVDWLSGIRWEWFATFTFAPRLTRLGKTMRPDEKWARKLLHAAINGLNRALFGKRFRRRGQGLLVILCWEPHRDGMPHAHALVRGCSTAVTYGMLKEWFYRHVGIARWYPVKPAAVKYVTKYCTKAGQDETWEILGPTAAPPGGPLFDGRAAQG